MNLSESKRAGELLPCPWCPASSVILDSFLANKNGAKVVRLPNPNNGDYYCDGMWDAETVKNAMDDAGVKYEIEGQP
jgi:hypothetical protein